VIIWKEKLTDFIEDVIKFHEFKLGGGLDKKHALRIWNLETMQGLKEGETEGGGIYSH
jgi:hypothetical protein